MFQKNKLWSNREPLDKNGFIFVHYNNLENLVTQIYQLEYGLDGPFLSNVIKFVFQYLWLGLHTPVLWVNLNLNIALWIAWASVILFRSLIDMIHFCVDHTLVIKERPRQVILNGAKLGWALSYRRWINSILQRRWIFVLLYTPGTT